MDAAVLRAYGWDDLILDARADFIQVEVDEGKRAKTRLDWPAAVKDEVLARLLRLNAERHAEEVRLGYAPSAAAADTDEEAEREAAE